MEDEASQHQEHGGTGAGSRKDTEMDFSQTDRLDPEQVRPVSPEPDEWHPAGNSALLKPGNAFSPHSASSFVWDGGEALRLAENADGAEEWHKEPVEGLVAHAGAHFGATEASLPSSISINSETDRHGPLGNALREHLAYTIDKDDSKKFLPISKLNEIVTPSNIAQELRRAGIPEDQIPRMSQQVHSMSTQGSASTLTTRRRILAILAFMEKSALIQEFIEEEIFDNHLPFNFGLERPDDDVCWEMKGGALQTIRLFKRWSISDRESFNMYQWWVLAPYFTLSHEAGQKVLHYDLHNRRILPFTKGKIANDDELDIAPEDLLTDLEGFSTQQGGFSAVRKVKIHPAHHNYCQQSASTEGLYFAVKELRTDQKTFKARGKRAEQEALNLKRFLDKKHDHLIRLLATYSHKDHFHMIFPWANCNLKVFWEKICPNPPRSVDLARWMCRQCLGIARALQSIHKSDVPECSIQDLDVEFKQQKHGRHGDLKPENILWFQEDKAPAAQPWSGNLTISDFGLMDFHGSKSLEIRKSELGGITQTYRAPEFDVNRGISPEYDIWSFGCVLLQFVTWYLLGWEGVDQFSQRRAASSRALIAEDTFFIFEESSDGEKSLKARLNPSVGKEIQSLRENHACSDFILEMLNHIQSNLLRLNPNNRSSCDTIVKTLEKIAESCDKDELYSTQVKLPRVQTTPSAPSELQSYPFSPEMEEHTRNNISPKIGYSSSNSAQSAQGVGGTPRPAAEPSLEATGIIDQMHEGDRPPSREGDQQLAEAAPGLNESASEGGQNETSASKRHASCCSALFRWCFDRTTK